MHELIIAHPEVEVQLTGNDGNVFAIIGNVAAAMKQAGLHTEAQAFKRACFAAGSYDEVLMLTQTTVTVR